MILFIDTASDTAEIRLYKHSTDNTPSQQKIDKTQLSETLLQHIENILQKNSATKQDLRAIICVQGPGHFTSLRIGIVTANTFATALKIPLFATRVGSNTPLKNILQQPEIQYIEPVYNEAAL